MRRKKHKHTRRTVRFYKINFGFRPPYKVLLDGNFVSAVESLKREDSKELITKLLGDPARVFTTKCVMQELRSLGKDFAETRHICKRYALHKCEHDDHTSASDCLLSQIENGNKEHFFVATQDRTLQRKVMESPGGACIFASVNGVHLETPSAMQKTAVQETDDAHMRSGAVEARSKSLKELTEAELRERGNSFGGPRIKRKQTKGPNPLAAKPKKKKPQPVPEQQQKKDGGGDEGEGQKKKRKRRKRGGDAGGDGGGGGSD